MPTGAWREGENEREGEGERERERLRAPTVAWELECSCSTHSNSLLSIYASPPSGSVPAPSSGVVVERHTRRVMQPFSWRQ